MITKGDRVELLSTSDPHTRLTPGEQGTVRRINENSLGTTVFIDWDSGSTLGLIEGEDSWRVISAE